MIDEVKKLRELTGAGVLECKKALLEAKGEIMKAIEILREKGKTEVTRFVGKETKEGLIFSYVHLGDKIGVLLELNCETDFVARTQEFKNLAKEIALQIAALGPSWIKKEDIPKEVIEKEKEIYRKQALSSGKPEKVINKIVEGKLSKFYEQVCLLEQPYIRDPTGRRKIKHLINSFMNKVGENVVLRRFVRYQLGEELD